MRCILFMLDGLRPDLIDPGLMPHLTALIAGGTLVPQAGGVFPTETRVAVSSLVTGCRPGSHGILNNAFFAPDVFPDRLLRTGKASDLRRLEAVRGRLLERPSLGERLAAAGRRMAVVSTGSGGACLLMHHRAEALDHFRWEPGMTEGATAEAVTARFGPAPPAGTPNAGRLAHATRVLLEQVLPELAPDLTIFWSNEPDLTFHHHGLGSPQAKAAMTATDLALGAVMAWREAQPDREEIVILAGSDHGHVTGAAQLDLAPALAAGGFPAGECFAKDVALVSGFGAGPGLWLRDKAMLAPLAVWLQAQPWLGALFAREPGDTGLPALDLFGPNHPGAPDLRLTFAGHEGPDQFGLPGLALAYDSSDVPPGGGMHGGLHRRELSTLFVANGGPMRRGSRLSAASDLTDIAPTLLHLLGLPGDGCEGRVLVGLWGGPEPAQAEERVPLGRGLVLEGCRIDGRFFPKAIAAA